MRQKQQEPSEITIDETLIFRKVLLHDEDGRQILKWLLLNLGLYKPVTTADQSVLQNFAIKILSVLDLVKQNQLEELIDHYKVLADKDALHPKNKDSIRRKLDARRDDD